MIKYLSLDTNDEKRLSCNFYHRIVSLKKSSLQPDSPEICDPTSKLVGILFSILRKVTKNSAEKIFLKILRTKKNLASNFKY